jgi:hypothetical protein
VTQQVSQIGGHAGSGRLEYGGVERVPRHFESCVAFKSSQVKSGLDLTRLTRSGVKRL